MPDALYAATFPISGLADQLIIRWPAYPEARLICKVSKGLKDNENH